MGKLDLTLRTRLLLPLVAVLLVVMVYPLVFSFWVSLNDYRLTRLADVHFIGPQNYLGLIGNESFWTALSNTVIFVLGAVTMELTLGFSLALLLHRGKYLRNFYRSVLLTPMFITPIAVGLMFRFLLNIQLGVVPHYLAKIGINIDWFGSELALFSLMLIDTWQWTPFMLLMLLAGLESLPKAPFEAARVDGASAWLIFRRITLPLMRPVIVAALIIRGLDAFKVFEYVYAITRGGPGDSTETILYHIYKVGFRFFRMGEAAAMSYVLIALTLVFVIVLYTSTKRN